MVELLPVDGAEDLAFLSATLKEFHEKTGSEVAQRLLKDWPKQARQFVKVGASGKEGWKG